MAYHIPNQAFRFKKGWQKLKHLDTAGVEFWFGIQGFATGMLSVAKYLSEGSDVTTRSSILLLLVSIASLPQIYGAITGDMKLRHYTNIIIMSLTAVLSVSLWYGNGEDIAIFGYLGITIASYWCVRYTANRHLNRK